MQAPQPTAQVQLVVGQPVWHGEPVEGVQENAFVPVGLGTVHGVPVAYGASQAISRPEGSRAQVQRSAVQLDICIPPQGMKALEVCCGCGCLMLFWVLFSNMPVIIAIWVMATQGADKGGYLILVFGILFGICSSSLLLLAAWYMLLKARWKETVMIDRHKFALHCQLDLASRGFISCFAPIAFRCCRRRSERHVERCSAWLMGARVVTTRVNPQGAAIHTAIELVERAGHSHQDPPTLYNVHRFGMAPPHMRLDQREQQWLVYEINSFIEETTGRKVDFSAMPPVQSPQVIHPGE